MPLKALPGGMAAKMRHEMKARPFDPGLEFFRLMESGGLLDVYCSGLEQPNGMRMAEALMASGAPEREITRYLIFTGANGEQAMDLGADCVFFAPVSCGDDNCLNPEHQRLTTDPAEQITW